MFTKNKEYYINFYELKKGFYESMLTFAELPEKSIFNFFKHGYMVSSEVVNYFDEILEDIFQFVLVNNLKPEDKSWKNIGFLLFMLACPKIETVKLPQEIIDHASPLVNSRKVCLGKIGEKRYFVVFK